MTTQEGQRRSHSKRGQREAGSRDPVSLNYPHFHERGGTADVICLSAMRLLYVDSYYSMANGRPLANIIPLASRAQSVSKQSPLHDRDGALMARRLYPFH